MLRNFRFRVPTNHPSSTINTDSRRLIRLPTRCSKPDLSHYTILGLTPLASQTEVKRAFKRLALKFHPDVHKGQDKDFKEIKSAHESLMQKFEEEEEIMEMGEIEEWEEWMGFEGGIPSGLTFHTRYIHTFVKMNRSRIREMKSTIFGSKTTVASRRKLLIGRRKTCHVLYL